MMLLRSILIWTGGIALLAATVIDTLAVIGRHVGLPIPGSIELMQPAILVVGATSLVASTLASNHARVHLFVDRLSVSLRSYADRISDFATALFFMALLGGSAWLAWDLWDAYEASELVGVPWRLMRLFANVCLLACVLITLRRFIARAAK